MPELLVLAEAEDRVAGAFARRCRARSVRCRRVTPWSLWSALSPELTMGRRGETRSTLWSRPVFSRVGALPDAGLGHWLEADRAYAAAESQAAFLAHLARHPNAVNRPLPDDFTGLGRRFPEQLALARSCGLPTPAWLFTSELPEARRFLAELGGTALYRRRCEDIFDFRLASPAALPVESGRLRTAAMFVAGRRGRPIVSTWACGALAHADARTGDAAAPPAPEERLRALFKASGLRFGQAIGIADAAGYSFYGLTGTPQLRFYRAPADALHDALIDGLQEAS